MRRPPNFSQRQGHPGFRYQRLTQAAEAIRYAIELPHKVLAGSSLAPSTRSIVSKYIRLGVTSGAFLYSSNTLRKRAACPVASATVCSL
jgi:hypothetical protein